MDCSVLIIFLELKHEHRVFCSTIDSLLAAEHNDECALFYRWVHQLKRNRFLLLFLCNRIYCLLLCFIKPEPFFEVWLLIIFSDHLLNHYISNFTCTLNHLQAKACACLIDLQYFDLVKLIMIEILILCKVHWNLIEPKEH